MSCVFCAFNIRFLWLSPSHWLFSQLLIQTRSVSLTDSNLTVLQSALEHTDLQLIFFFPVSQPTTLSVSPFPQALQEKVESLQRQLHATEKKLLSKELETEEKVT